MKLITILVLCFVLCGCRAMQAGNLAADETETVIEQLESGKITKVEAAKQMKVIASKYRDDTSDQPWYIGIGVAILNIGILAFRHKIPFVNRLAPYKK